MSYWQDINPTFFVAEQKAVAASRYNSLHFFFRGQIVHLSGPLEVDASKNGQRLTGSFQVVIEFPGNYPDGLPVAYEPEGRTRKFKHRYPGGRLCLETDAEAWLIFRTNPTVVHFLESLVVPFFYNFLCFEKNGSPFQDRPHGAPGLVAYYCEKLGLPTSTQTALGILSNLLYKNSRMLFTQKQSRILGVLRKLPSNILRQDFRIIRMHWQDEMELFRQKLVGPTAWDGRVGITQE